MSKTDMTIVALILAILIVTQSTLVYCLTKIEKNMEKTTQLLEIVIKKYNEPEQAGVSDD